RHSCVGIHCPMDGLPWVTHQEADSAGIWLPGEVRVGWGVSEVQAAFVTTLAGTGQDRRDRACSFGISRMCSLRLQMNHGVFSRARCSLNDDSRCRRNAEVK